MKSHLFSKIRLFPGYKIVEMLYDLKSSHYFHLSNENKVDDEHRRCVKNEIVASASQVLPWQHANSKEDQGVGNKVITLEEKEQVQSKVPNLVHYTF